MITLETCPGLEVKFKVVKSTNKHGAGFRPIEDVIRRKNESVGFVQVTEDDDFLIRAETHATKLAIQCKLSIDRICMADCILDEYQWYEFAGRRFTDGLRGYRMQSQAIVEGDATDPGIYGCVRLDVAYYHIESEGKEENEAHLPPPKGQDEISQAVKDDTGKYTASLTVGFSSPRKAKRGKVAYCEGNVIQELGSIFIHYRTKGETDAKRAFEMGPLGHAVSKVQEDKTQGEEEQEEEEGTLSLPLRTKRRPPDNQAGVGDRSRRVQQSGPDKDSQ